MDALDRRTALRMLVGGVAAVGLGASVLPHSIEAMPLAAQKDLQKDLDTATANDPRPDVHTVQGRGRPDFDDRDRRRRRRHRHRRKVCWWRRGRRVCEWRW